MRRVVLVLCVLALLAPVPGAADGPVRASYVDPFIGTFGSGFVFPGPAAPHGMVQLSPDTEGYFAYTGYLWSDRFIRGFSHVHIQSMGVHMGGNLPFMPTVGAVASTDPLRYMAPFDHAAEDASPGYYSVLLGSGIRAELTAGVRVGLHRYTFPPGESGNVLMDVGRSVPRSGSDPLRPGPHEARIDLAPDGLVTGSATTTGRGAYTVHFAARFSREPDSVGTWDAALGVPTAGSGSAEGVGAGGYVSFDGGGEVLVKVGISFVDVDGALANLEAELPGDDFGFEALRRSTRDAWNEVLGKIRVGGGTSADLRSFYTALYHAQHHPNVFSDADGRWMGYDGQVRTAVGWTPYANFSMWDTYRGQMPLLSVISPDRYRDMVRTLLESYRQVGRFPKWALQNAFPDYMIGEPVMPVLAEAWCRDLVDADIASELYDTMRTQVFDHHRDPSFLDGFVLRDYGGASETLEHSIAAFSFALVADRLGHADDRDAALALAQHWRNAIDPSIGFARPRDSQGDYRDPYEPMLPDGFVEGTGWQYTWLVPHDVTGLYEVIGGDDTVRDRLDTFFSTWLAATSPAAAEVQKHITLFGIDYYGNQYAPSNEHDLQAPYMYNWTSQPWKSQAVVRGLQGLYRPTPDGLPGNDDLGTLSAWYVWSALGFYPAVSGAPLYVIGSPVFLHSEIVLPDGRFTVKAPGASPVAKYVKAATLDGQTLDATWLPDAALRAGAELVLEMDVLPNLEAAPAAPPSLSGDTLQAFGCRP